MVNLLIADDHPLYRDALKGALGMAFSDLNILESGDLNATVKTLEENDVDLLLLDLHMPGSSDLFGLLHIQKTFSDLPIAVVSGTEDTSLISKVVGVGAMGFIPKTASAQEISDAVNAMLEGDVWVPEALRQQIEQVDENFSVLAENVASLTPSQYKVLCYMRDGLLNKQIGYNLEIAEATVKAHVTAIFRKLGINNRTQAVLIASELQLEPPSN
ncbi:MULTISPECIES: response regulator transcription factor [Alteromonadaceae]|uniref:Response regulator transcription factor n=1 Tax=Brumicola blandensis TaxID=3075611 RepID=A0AAW8R4W5_9ALTE|nr:MULTISPECIES: response regulator transcription factor [unclassified Alteromonas]MDT0583176.1 response regulator transcription factor [Alteromonas sp. W409]MDT0627482.1 response regulator transcription factor [Alteromonas sp. W364]